MLYGYSTVFMNLFVKLIVLLYTFRVGVVFLYNCPPVKYTWTLNCCCRIWGKCLQPRCIALAPNVGAHHLWTDDLKDKRKEAAVWLVRSDERACIGILVWLCSLCDSNCCFTPRPVLDYIRKSFVGHVYPCSSSFRKCAVTKSPKQHPVCESLSLSVRIS